MNDMTIPAATLDRSRFIGGSDTAAVMSVSPWKTPLELWAEKTGRSSQEDDPAKAKIFARGKRWEPIALEMLIDTLVERGHAVELIETNKRYQDAELPFLACEIDAELRLDGEHVNVEIKTVHPFAQKKWGDADTDEVPIEYAAQVMHGLGITGRRLCVVGCLIGADNMIPYFVERDNETIEAMRAKCSEFWNVHVLGDTAPDPLNFQDLKFLFARDNGTAKQADAAIAEMVSELATLQRVLKNTEEQADELKFQIQSYMEPAAILEYNGQKLCTWKSQSATRFDSKAFSAMHPALAEQFKKTSESRVFRLSIK